MALALMAVVPSWAGGPVAPKQVALSQVGQEANGGEVTLAAGQLLEVVLPENASTGYSWELTGALGPTARVVDDVSEYTSNMPGAGGLRRVLLRGLEAGSATFTAVYRRPWETGVAPIESFTLTLKVGATSQNASLGNSALQGDLNGDGIVSIQDVIFLLRYLVGL
jgi:inhibitor of cysteine peptidase